MDFSKKLLVWYFQNRRSLPWRDKKFPYNVWLSEIILQQTRVSQGLPYYKKFIKTFPDIKSLASADENEILKLWQGLGYYSRARNLLTTAITLVNDFDGKFPKDFHKIKSLKGIGDYTASAIVSICYGQKQAVVDGNVYRVLSRIFGITISIDSPQAYRVFKTKSTELMNNESPGDFNQAMMEFGAIQCKPKSPDCKNCIFSDVCFAFKKKMINTLPRKKSKIKIKKRFFNFIVIIDGEENTILEKRKNKDIWRNLYQFPMIEQSKRLDLIKRDSLNRMIKKYKIDKDYLLKKWNEKPIIHNLSHQRLEVVFWILKTRQKGKNSIEWKSFKDYPTPKLIQNFKEKFFIN